MPHVPADAARTIARDHWGITGAARPLDGYLGQNFHIAGPAGEFVLKIADASEDDGILDLQNQAMARVHDHAADVACPLALPSLAGQRIERVTTGGESRSVRLLTFLPGTMFVDAPKSPELRRDLGAFLARLDQSLAGFAHPAATRTLVWDLQQAGALSADTHRIEHGERRRLVEECLGRFANEVTPRAERLRRQVIHNDANDYNLLVAPGARRIGGIFDFGDVVETWLVNEVAIACAYAVQWQFDALAAAADVVAGYHATLPLEELELEVLPDLIATRLCTTVIMACRAGRDRTDNEYLGVSERPAWRALEQFAAAGRDAFRDALRAACGLAIDGESAGATDLLLAARAAHLGPMLSLSYRRPLAIARGSGQYLFDDRGRAYLDVVNNVCHVGHCHPHVVAAGQRQMAELNTNTRYLHPHLVRYAARLTATLPDPLSVVFMVCSGSEANDLALRLARAHTQGRDVVVVDGAYHGNLGSLIELSPYKFAGPGGQGRAQHVHVVPAPDDYRGRHRRGEPDLGARYAGYVGEAIAGLQQDGRRLAAFFCESILSCGGQIVLPDGYLRAAYAAVRAAGGVCVADEVQVGFGRVGSDMWAFEAQGVVPDIVTVGKPMGNGHPVAAVITTPAIAASFDTGMEYFNTYGGNPVSCAIADAVLDVIEREDLQTRARRVGDHFLVELRRLAETTPLIGDVRGRGLFLGIELVRDPETLEPADDEAGEVVERMRDLGILLSTDGPLHNVIKMKPPLVFEESDADEVVGQLGSVLTDLGQTRV